MSTALLATVCRIASSLLNAAGWKNYLLGAMTATSTTLTCTDAAFLATDVGKSIAVDGAGTGGTILQSTIATYVSATQVTLADAAVVTVVGATISYGGRLADDRRNLLELRELAFEADEAFYLPIAETPGHWARPDIMSLSASIANAAEIPEHVGEIGQVLIQIGPLDAYLPGKPSEFEEIARLRENTGTAPLNVYGALAHNVAGSQIGGYYRISEDGTYVNYTGSDCKIPLVAAYSRGTDLKSPLILTGAIASIVVARALAKEGSRTPEQAAVHAGYAEAVIQAIRANKKPLPELESFESKAQQKEAA